MKKTLKEPKTFERPRAYMRIDGKKKIKFSYLERIRIIYTDGKAEWADGVLINKSAWGIYYPCWHDNYKGSFDKTYNSSSMSAEEAVKAMKQYDKSKGFRTLYLGEF